MPMMTKNQPHASKLSSNTTESIGRSFRSSAHSPFKTLLMPASIIITAANVIHPMPLLLSRVST